MTLDITARALALRLIAKNGKSITYIDVIDGVYDPATGSAAPTETSYQLKGIVEDYSYRSAGAGFAAGLVREGDKHITIAASGLVFTPQAGDRVTVDGTTYAALNVKAVYSGELVAIYEVHGRQ
jgi:hypothetical protein